MQRLQDQRPNAGDREDRVGVHPPGDASWPEERIV